MLQKIKDWLKSNWKPLSAGLLCGALAFGSIGYGCGFVSGCSKAEKKAEEKK
jgi:hypothetical protein